jgi:ribosomal protein S24E
MEITIGKTSENPFLKRKEVHGKVGFQGATPSQKQLADALATKLGAKADAIFVAHVFTEFGAQSATFEAHVYPSKEQLDKVVKLGKKAKEKAAKAAPAPAAAPAEAAKPEAKKEEPKAEEKKEAPKVEEKKEAAKA